MVRLTPWDLSVWGNVRFTISSPHTAGHLRTLAPVRCRVGQAGAVKPRDQLAGEQLVFGIVAVGQTVPGVIDVIDAVVTMENELPSLLGPRLPVA